MDEVKKYGIIGGIAFVIWQYLEYYTGLHYSDFAVLSHLVAVPVLIICIFMAIRARRIENGGYIEFNEGLKTGLGTSAIAAIVFSIGQYILNRWIIPDKALAEAEQFKNTLIQLGKNAAEIQTDMESFISAYPFRSSLLALAGLIFMGGIISIIISATMRRKQPPHLV